MIDFRYHIVSLIAVFLALAVGIALGAGPLQGSLGDRLSEEVDNLRTDNENRRAEIAQLQDDVQGLDAVVDAAATRLLPGSLVDVDVAVVTMPGADVDVADALVARVEQAGGDVVAQVGLDARWTDPGQAQARAELAVQITSQMLVPPAADASTEQILGTGLGQALTQSDPLSSEGFTTAAEEIYASLRDAQLLSEIDAPSAPADATLVVAPTSPETDDDTDLDALAATLDIEVSTVAGLVGTDVVVAGTADTDNDLVTAIRADGALVGAVSTVDSADDVAGQVIAPLALAARTAGDVIGAYGTGDDVDSVLPPVVEQPVDPGEEETS